MRIGPILFASQQAFDNTSSKQNNNMKDQNCRGLGDHRAISPSLKAAGAVAVPDVYYRSADHLLLQPRRLA